FMDEQLRHVGPIGVGGIDKVDAEIGEPLQRAERFLAVRWRAPNAFASDAHGAKAEAIDLDITADLEAAGLRCVDLNHSIVCLQSGLERQASSMTRSRAASM